MNDNELYDLLLDYCREQFTDEERNAIANHVRSLTGAQQRLLVGAFLHDITA